jgi:hypothetical protein
MMNGCKILVKERLRRDDEDNIKYIYGRCVKVQNGGKNALHNAERYLTKCPLMWVSLSFWCPEL